MPRQVFSFDPPDRFVLGTVGQPGERTFYLQASGAGKLVSVVLEKQYAQALAERLDALLDEIRRRGGDVPAVAPPELDDVAPLDQPIVEEFRVAALALSWDGADDRVVIEAQEVAEDDEEEQGKGDVLRVRIPASVARAFTKRARRVVASGRPPCPLCGFPLDPEGHVCPRQNGHRH